MSRRLVWKCPCSALPDHRKEHAPWPHTKKTNLQTSKPTSLQPYKHTEITMCRSNMLLDPPRFTMQYLFCSAKLRQMWAVELYYVMSTDRPICGAQVSAFCTSRKYCCLYTISRYQNTSPSGSSNSEELRHQAIQSHPTHHQNLACLSMTHPN